MHQGWFSLDFLYLNAKCIMVLATMSPAISWQYLGTNLFPIADNKFCL